LAPGAGDPSRKAPGDEAALPLPLRYAVEVRCRADFGEVLLLGVECPAAAAAGEPSFLWWVSGGRVEPAEGGESAVWHLPDDGAPAVAVCAVQTGALDLQVASYRVG
jgi:hypothetical protein